MMPLNKFTLQQNEENRRLVRERLGDFLYSAIFNNTTSNVNMYRFDEMIAELADFCRSNREIPFMFSDVVEIITKHFPATDEIKQFSIEAFVERVTSPSIHPVLNSSSLTQFELAFFSKNSVFKYLRYGQALVNYFGEVFGDKNLFYEEDVSYARGIAWLYAEGKAESN